MRNRILLLCFLFPLLAHAVKVPFHLYYQPHSDFPEVQPPWFTGPLLAPSSFVVPQGHVDIEPYVYFQANTGFYGSDWKTKDMSTFWVNYSQTLIEFGLLSWLDFELNPTVYYNYKHGAGKWNWGDMPIGFNIQLYTNHARVTEWLTAFKLILRATVPMGKYQNMNPKKLLTDFGGLGNWQPGIGLVWGNLFHLGGHRFMTWRTAIQYILPTPVHVKNLNVFGGAAGTKGTVYPAQNVEFDTALELNLTQHWALCCDFVGIWAGKTRFKGTATAPMTSPPGLQFSLAPGIEYNWNASIGVVAGSWFTIAGRNLVNFTQALLAFNWYY